jgi:hypothetical protein
MLLGDFNAFQFNDGVMDMIGTIKGKPAPKDSVLMASDDLVTRDLIDLVDAIAAPQRYSYVFDGNAQTLDHVLINEPLRKHINGFGFVRVNADFPESMRNDASRPDAIPTTIPPLHISRLMMSLRLDPKDAEPKTFGDEVTSLLASG